MAERLFTTDQIANLVGETPGAVAEWIDKGWLPSKSLPNGPVRISERGLIQFLKSRGVDIEEIMAKTVIKEGEYLQDEGETYRPSTPAAAAAPAQPPPAAETATDPAAQLADAIVRFAVARRTSHIHLESGPDGLALRLRIDGVLHDKANFTQRLPSGLGPKLLRHLKTSAGLDADQTHRPQSGSFAKPVGGQEIELSVSTLPTVYGERLVIGLRDRDAPPPDLSQLGLAGQAEARIRGLVAQPHGLVLVAAPPRNGRSTTLRAMAKAIDSRRRSVVAMEKSVECRIERVSHSLITAAGDVTYSSALEAVVRQDADVIIVDDLPSPASATTAVEAAYDGRLVLAGIRGGSAAEAVSRLLEMGVDGWVLGSTLRAVIAPRSLRKLCESCKQQVGLADPAHSQCAGREELGTGGDELDFPMFVGQGCGTCSNTGYLGRTGVFSIMYVSGEVGRLIRRGADAEAVNQAALRGGMQTLREAGIEKLRAGVTSAEELAALLSSA